jgi:hypothetical protein
MPLVSPTWRNLGLRGLLLKVLYTLFIRRIDRCTLRINMAYCLTAFSVSPVKPRFQGAVSEGGEHTKEHSLHRQVSDINLLIDREISQVVIHDLAQGGAFGRCIYVCEHVGRTVRWS